MKLDTSLNISNCYFTMWNWSTLNFECPHSVLYCRIALCIMVSPLFFMHGFHFTWLPEEETFVVTLCEKS